MPYNVRDISLAPQGEEKIEWVQRHMPVLEHIKREFEEKKPFKGITIASCLHLEPKTINLGLTLMAGGAEVAMTGCNPLSTQDDAAAAGASLGLNIYGWRGETTQEYYENIHRVLDHEPDILIDDGADMIFLAHRERPEILDKIRGACEETTTGIHRLRAMAEDGALRFPVMAVNDAYTKYLFDNRYGTGQSTLDSIMGATNMLIAGKTVVICGYGWCGRGIAMRADGLGANVIITEVDPIRALEARMDGFRVMKVNEAVRHADILITATGNIDVVSLEDFKKMKDGCIMANAGHFNVEINRDDLLSLSVNNRIIREDIEEFILEDGRRLYLLAEGRLVNLASTRGQGHPAEIMDMSFSLQALSAQHLLSVDYEPGVYKSPDEIDLKVARLKLESMNIEIDELTPRQVEYLSNWQEGT
ncbi:MAG TPA: adenosylhomocysteinase [Methanothermobacter sp.]|jgi:adenosylhomocysteinase|uniref:S-inosyl-L-homocysteine hydrolase n=1 Tax=Methanothermobacter tenebrarum TaxID=680118 RepID=A0ABM7YFB8_9EURY|nr:adenosylhomocysteinase [Methanothermobacter tenebrarum]MDI6882083.1 adenosylhomocysteinase [Methanothermobacter sp.]MDX9692895.1 adenosylhomocysteinase [Methanothermobacter sp.]BDH80007.1 S-adenosyl-L-homocysteine hydrolase [Methanothermobacter tenebrarum]HHW16440.1 adenosylhomocysteinase [Methanothermobacter sp.]HOQ20619.1 adenosylhomocysteinase [Methanothermobacter sp.]